MKEKNTLRLAGIVRESIVDGPGIRFTVFCQGCPHGCQGCHNPETHDFSGGKEVSLEKILQEIDKDPLLAGVTFSGGEPFCQAGSFARLAELVKERGLSVTVFSGYTYEALTEAAEKDREVRRLLELTDILIDGPYVEEERDLTLQFRGSGNQRIIDMEQTRKTGTVSLWKQ
ncbi:MAG TPA: anaerobic ribonucleoside-triphosphate reductase activating protein [Candidatus Copromorpha excrementigallinarum]|uniref:Anaerobic ribonucleoside-triphosphate reductase-activating protein n=1 Tax=Candidatus Allocopromorpha excrementigallinarum TaxID=2840742 RepID=A0A9D1I3G0_9FIRM|nr:anaerobic ribonucleoside-triphosphate reductase activating protein [Candidatus Copromorpha excrementigallinarum]